MKKATTLALVLLTGATLAGTAAAEPPAARSRSGWWST
ncbi:hypothetical protein ASALC70_01110 [Alcanivorax sp. ALC70]|nr:hypothetical protein ASALC70_01110 [Alcanivorax sp. ALC70]